jgi:hypothetical protein
MTYFTKYDYTIIRKHWIILFFKYLKFLFFVLLALIFFLISIKFSKYLWKEIIYYLLFPIIFLLLNYAFIKLILYYIVFYNNLLIINNWQIIVIKSSLFFRDDIEIIDINKITKMDIFCRGIFLNMIWFWNLVIEQQRDQVRAFHFIENPHLALQIIKDAKDIVIENDKLKNSSKWKKS